jgi:flagellar hook assembly protein FlgD
VTPPVTVAHLALAAPSPNPSSALTRLDFELPTAGVAELAVFDASGRRVATLAEGEQSAGVHSASWDGRSAGGARAAAGLYFARLVTPQGSVSRRIVRAN